MRSDLATIILWEKIKLLNIINFENINKIKYLTKQLMINIGCYTVSKLINFIRFFYKIKK